MKEKIVNLRINVKKITEEKLYKGANGTYLEESVLVSEKENKYGTHCSIW